MSKTTVLIQKLLADGMTLKDIANNFGSTESRLRAVLLAATGTTQPKPSKTGPDIKLPDRGYLNSIMVYQPQSGRLYSTGAPRLTGRSPMKGFILGTTQGAGQSYIDIDGVNHWKQRICWLMYHYEELSGSRIAFKNGDRSDCRISNLVSII